MYLDKSDLDLVYTFNEQVGKLSRSSFAKWVHERYPKNDSSWLKVFENMRISVQNGLYFPDNESVEAYILTFRILTQDNDCSIRNLAAIYEKLPENNKTKQSFNALREDLNKYLDTDSSIYDGSRWTRREIMDNMLYGYFAHTNKKKKEVVDGWMSSNPHLKSIVLTQFTSALAVIYIAFSRFQALNLDLIYSIDL